MEAGGHIGKIVLRMTVTAPGVAETANVRIE
jgi:hypothetical protein